MKRALSITIMVLLGMSVFPLSGQVLTTLHSFTNKDGAEPYAGVTASGNALFGTTEFGGATGNGTIFTANTDGTGFSVIHSFTYSDGGDIKADLFLARNTLYGASYQGGSGIQQGSLFSLGVTGSSYTNIHNFGGAPDGDDPKAGLLLSGNTLYGTAFSGTGASVDGSVFSLETNGANFTTLHTFTGIDGNGPLGDLVLGGNVLYGTTYNGGASNLGTIFSVQTNGSNFLVLHSFSNTDGTLPAAGLVLSGGTLYGTASAGGKYGVGTIFSINTNGSDFTVLYSFVHIVSPPSTDGETPLAALFLSSNVLYGTASAGGTSGNGTVFSISTAGTNYTQLYSFGVGDGNEPAAPVILLGNSLYGTTVVGGTGGNGTLFGLQIKGIIFTFEPFGATNVQVNGGAGFGAGGESLSFPNATIQYQWRLNGVNIPGQTTEGLSYSDVQPTNGGEVTMTISDGAESATSVPVGFSVAVATQASGNDNFANRFSLGSAASGVVASSNTTATRETGEPEILAGNPGGKSIWFKWVPAASGTATFTAQGSQFDTMMGVYTGASVSALSRVPSAVNDDDAGGYLTSKVPFACVAGTEYEIVVDGYWGASGNVVLSWVTETVTAPLASLLQVPPIQTIASNGGGVTLVCQPSSGVPSWLFNGQSTGVTGTNYVIGAVDDATIGTYVAQVTTAGGVASTEPVHVQANTLEDGTSDPNSVAWNKFLDSANAAYTNPPQSSIRKLGGGGDTRGYSVAQSFSTVGSTSEPGEPSIAGQIGGSPVWYTYVTATNGAMLIDTAGSSFNTMLGVFIGPGNSFATLTNIGAGFTTNRALDGQPEVYIPTVPQGQTNFIVVDGYGGASGTVHLSINLGDTVVISTPPQNQYVIAGSNATFTVGADGSTPLSYLWQFNGTNIAGATNDSLTIPNVQTTNTGVYTVVVSNLVSVASNSATLFLGTPPVVTTQPLSQIVAAGGTVKLNVTASGTPAPDYQWMFDGGPIGTDSSSLSVPNFQAGNEGTYSVIVSNALGGAASSNALVLLNGAPVIVTANNRSKPYGQTVTFVGTEFTASGLESSNSVNSVTLTSSGAAAMATVVGSPYAIVPSAAVGTGLNNYTLIYSNGALTVSPVVLTITANSLTKSYGQTVTFAGTEFTVSGLVNSDSVSNVNLASSGAPATATVGGSPYSIVPSAAAGVGLTNYTINYVNGSLTVTDATPIISWANPLPITYGTALGSNQLDATTSVPGSFVYTPTNGTVFTSGTNTLSVIFTPTDTTDYINVTNTVSLVVLPASLTVTASNQTKTYGQSVTFAGTEFTTAGLVNGDTVSSVTLASSGAGASASVAGSPYPIVPSAAVGAGLTNYTITYFDGQLSVSQASPIITWTNPAPIIYGTALGSNQLDALPNVAGSFAYEPTNGAVLDTGTNLLSAVFTPIDALDYNSATDTVSLVVLPAPLIVTASDASRLYGADNPVFTGEIIGLTNDDNITVTYTCGASTNSPPGMYDIVPSLVDPNDSETNYVVSLIDGTLTVTGAVTGAAPQITLQPTNQSVLLGGAASFSVNAAGNAPLAYQWQFVGTNLVFATNTVLIFNAVASTNAGSYEVVITNSFGAITSATVTLSVLGVPVSFDTTSGGIQFSNGQLSFSLSGLTGQGSVLVEASSDLLQWIPVFTNPPGFGTIQFVDPAATNYQNRYYRISTPGP